MKVQLTKAYKLVNKILPKGRIVEVSNDLGRELIKKKVGKEVHAPSFDEDALETFKTELNKSEE